MSKVDRAIGLLLGGLGKPFLTKLLVVIVPNLIHSVFTPVEWVSHWAAIWLALVLVSYDLEGFVIMHVG